MIDSTKITDAIVGLDVGSLSKEEGAELAEAWIAAGVCADKGIAAVECGFVLWLDPRTAVIGVQDLITLEPVCELPGEVREAIGRATGTIYVGNEWKTTAAPSKWHNEEKWLGEISSGSQLAIYALAMQSGAYFEKGSNTVLRPEERVPVIRVRAVSKSSPPMIWPSKEHGLVTFTQSALDNTRNALMAKAASVRAMRRAGAVPWQLPGIWCENKYRRVCEYHEECLAGVVPVGYGVFQPSDPATALSLPHIERADDPDTVILGASAYAAVSECPEKYRRNGLGLREERSQALDTGTVLHAAVACYYQQLKEEQAARAAEMVADISRYHSDNSLDSSGVKE